jgi:hypothetical protein
MFLRLAVQSALGVKNIHAAVAFAMSLNWLYNSSDVKDLYVAAASAIFQSQSQKGKSFSISLYQPQ